MILQGGLSKQQLEDVRHARKGTKRKRSIDDERPKPKRRKHAQQKRKSIISKIAQIATPPRLLRSRSFELKIRSIKARDVQFNDKDIKKALSEHCNVEDAFRWLQMNATPMTPAASEPAHKKDLLFSTIDQDGDGMITFGQILSACKNTILKLVSKKDVKKQFYKACKAHPEVEIKEEETLLSYSQFYKVWNDFVNGIVQKIDLEKKGSVSGKQLYTYLYSIHGRPTWFAKGEIHKSFKRILEVAGERDELSRDGALRVFSLWISKQVKTEKLLTFPLRKTLGL